MLKKTIIFFIQLLLFLNMNNVLSQERRTSNRIKIIVTADSTVHAAVETYIKRELQALKAVILTDENPDWVLNFNAILAKDQFGMRLGIVISMVISETFMMPYAVKSLYPEKKDIQDFVEDYFSGQAMYLSNHLYTDSVKNLPKLCKSVVNDFNIFYFEKYQEIYRPDNVEK